MDEVFNWNLNKENKNVKEWLIAKTQSTLPTISPLKNRLVSNPVTDIERFVIPQKMDKYTLLEWRLGVQESTSVGILEKLSGFKEDMLEQLKQARQFEKEQRDYQEFVREELKALVKAMTDMNVEVKEFEANVRDKWRTVNSAASTLKNLENHHSHSLVDVKERFARCDQAIFSTSQKINELTEEIRSFEELFRRETQDFESRLKAQQDKVGNLSDQLERVSSTNQANLQRIEQDFGKRLMESENKQQHQFTMLREKIISISKEEHAERRQLEDKLNHLIESALVKLENRVRSAEQMAEDAKVDEDLVARVDELEANFSHFKQQVLKTFKELESRMNKMSEDLYAQQQLAVDNVTEELRQGMSAMQDTVNSVKSLLENKLKLSNDNTQMELAQLRKLIALL